MSGSRQLGFEAVFFDLCNTLLHFDYSLLPAVEYHGESLPTTSRKVYQVLQQERALEVPYRLFFEEFQRSLSTVTEMRSHEHREFSSHERFRIMCKRLAIDTDLASLVVDAHMEEMLRIMFVPEETHRVLERLDSYPLILVSNFDHAPTVRRALEKFGLTGFFKKIFISDEMGWRKPGQDFFSIVVKESGTTPQSCLYVGDDPEADVFGAKRQGFKVAWLKPIQTPVSLEILPDWTLSGLSEVLNIIER